MEALAFDQIAEDKFKTLLTRGSTEIISFRVYRFRETAGSWTIIAIAGPALPRPFTTFFTYYTSQFRAENSRCILTVCDTLNLHI